MPQIQIQGVRLVRGDLHSVCFSADPGRAAVGGADEKQTGYPAECCCNVVQQSTKYLRSTRRGG